MNGPYVNSLKYEVKSVNGECTGVTGKVCIEIDHGMSKYVRTSALFVRNSKANLFLAGRKVKVKGPAPPEAVKLVFNYTETGHAEKRHIVSTYLKKGLVRKQLLSNPTD